MTANQKKKTEVKKADLKKSRVFNKREIKLLGLILLLGFTLRIYYILESASSPFMIYVFSDAKIYTEQARFIINSGSWILDEPFFMSPGYSYFLAIVFTLLGESFTAVRIIQALLSTGAILFVFLAARNLFNQRTAYISAFAAAIYSVFIFYTGNLLGETLQAFLISIVIYLFSVQKPVSKNKHWITAGLIFGVASLFRANILFFVPVLLLWSLYIYIKKNALWTEIKSGIYFFIAGVLIPVFAITLINYIAGKDFVIISSNGGINYFIGNNKDATGVFTTPKNFDFFRDMAGEKFAEKLLQKDLLPSEASAYWFGQGIEFNTSNPSSSIYLILKKLLLFFDHSENPQSSVVDINFAKENFSDLLKLPLPGFFVIAVISVFGFYYAARSKKMNPLILLFTISYIISVVVFFVIGRFRVGIASVFLIFAAYGINETISCFESKNLKALIYPSIAAILFAVLIIAFSPNYNYPNYDAFNNLGNIYFDKNQIDDAIVNYEKSIQIKPNEVAYVLLGNAQSVKQNYSEALSSYQKAIALSPNFALAYFNLGGLYSRQGVYDKALQNFMKTLEIDPSFSEAYKNLGIIYYIIEDYQSSLEYFEKYLSMVKDENIRATVLQDINEIKRRLGSN
ncbi:MAG: tetratricopeptide repeat protein [Ignavibacteriaceae bacterium]|nr:tetratricopeptide repeat protein [Ignavibacteriaceae bacterium]